MLVPPRAWQILGLAVATATSSAKAEREEPREPRVHLDGGLTLSRFEQQVKSDVGTEPGERLVEHSEIGLLSMLAYRFWGPLSAGGFLQFDAGERSAARFAGFADDGRTQVEGEIGGSYYELWMGPFLRAHWRGLFAEIGYGAYGARHDTTRDDLPSESGATEGLLRTHPTIAWLFALGASVPVNEDVSAVLRVEYRIRYYVSRSGDALEGEIVHGTQNVTPFFGVRWTFGPR